MNRQEGRITGVNGVEIFWQSWTPDAPRALAVLVHGLGEHSGRYQEVAQVLCAAGCAVYAMDHRGHGKSGGKRALVDRFAHAVSDIDQVIDLAQREHSGLKTFLIGHSMGGALSLSYTLRDPSKLDALILSGPAVALDGAPPLIGPISKVLGMFMPSLGMFSIDPSNVSRDQSIVDDYASDPLNAHGKVPARTLSEIVKFVEFLPAALPQLKLPMLIMHGEQDKLAGVSGSQMVADGASSKDKKLIIYKDLYHEIFNELPEDRAVVFKDLTNWIDQKLAA